MKNSPNLLMATVLAAMAIETRAGRAESASIEPESSIVKVPSEFAVSEGRSGVFGVDTQDSDGDGLSDAWEGGGGTV